MYYSTVIDMFTIPDAFHHAVQYSTELLYVVIMTMNFSLLHTFSYQKTLTRQPPAAPRRVRPIRHHIFFPVPQLAGRDSSVTYDRCLLTLTNYNTVLYYTGISTLGRWYQCLN